MPDAYDCIPFGEESPDDKPRYLAVPVPAYVGSYIQAEPTKCPICNCVPPKPWWKRLMFWRKR